MGFLISKGGKHAATFVVIHMTKLLTGRDYRRAFQEHVRIRGAKPFPFFRVSEIRFSTLEILSLNFYKWFPFIFSFLIEIQDLLTDFQKKLFAAMRDPDVLAIIKIRAIKAYMIDLPFMKTSNQLKKTDEYQRFLHQQSHRVSSLLSRPDLLLQNSPPRLAPQFDEEVEKKCNELDLAFISRRADQSVIKAISKPSLPLPALSALPSPPLPSHLPFLT